ncbi:MAG: SDR family oxidoreductase [Sphingobacteriia bacterium]|nr:SDR family oxidoreductase [Sphingobacteriia bacterium]
MINPMDLTGKIVLITGASSGIGRETAIQCSKLGARLVVVARREKELREAIDLMDGKDHSYYTFDLANIEGIEDLVSKIVKENGPIDGFVHSAGIGSTRPIHIFTHDKVHDVMVVNFYSFLELVRIISKKNNFNPGLSIVGISSMASITCKTGQTAYSASKAAMNAAIKCLALELSSKKIRINALLPSMIATSMWERCKSDYNRDESYYKTGGGLGVGQPLDVAQMAAYLLSDAAIFITRDEIQITGGYHGQVD